MIHNIGRKYAYSSWSSYRLLNLDDLLLLEQNHHIRFSSLSFYKCPEHREHLDKQFSFFSEYALRSGFLESSIDGYLRKITFHPCLGVKFHLYITCAQSCGFSVVLSQYLRYAVKFAAQNDRRGKLRVDSLVVSVLAALCRWEFTVCWKYMISHVGLAPFSPQQNESPENE